MRALDGAGTGGRRHGFFGRGAELAELRACLEDALAGRGGVVLIAGEPGIGKTRLAEELCGHAAGQGVPVLRGRTVDADGAPPYWAWRQVLVAAGVELRAFHLGGRDRGGPDRGGPDRGGPDRGGPDLGAPVRAAPELLDPAEVSAGLDTSPLTAGERFRLFEAMSSALREHAAPRGSLILLDDLHWADAGSLLVLRHLARDLGRSRLLLLAPYRDAEIGAAAPVLSAIADVAREPATTTVTLRGLGRAEVAEQLAATVGRELPAALVDEVDRRTNGNPLFVAELARLMRDEARRGLGDPAGVRDRTVPESVRQVIRRRVDLLSPPCQRMLHAASVNGREFTPDTVAALLGADADDVVALLDEAEKAQLVVRGPGPPSGLDFAHALTRETLYRGLDGAARRRLHGRLAEQIETRRGAGGGGEHLAELAHHWSAASPDGRSARAHACARRAGDEAMQQLGFEEAVRLYALALRVRPDEVDEAATARLLVDLACATHRAGDFAGAAETSAEAATVARRLGDHEVLGRAALVLEGIGEPAWSAGARALAEEALQGLDPADSPMRTRLLAQLATTCYYSGAADRVSSLSADALAMAERLGDDAALIAALRARQMARSGPDGVRERLTIADRTLEIAGRTGQPVAAMWGHLWRIDALMQLGDVPRAVEELFPLSLAVDRVREPLARWHLERARAAIAQVQGRFAEARGHADEALAIARAGGHAMAQQVHRGLMTVVSALTGEPAAAVGGQGDDAEMFGALVQSTVAWHAAMAGRRGEAEALYRRLPALSAWHPPVSVATVAMVFRGQAAALLGRAGDAPELYGVLLPYAEQFGSGGAGLVASHGSLHLTLGMLASRLGRQQVAIGHLEAAIDRNGRAGAHPYVALARHRLADVLSTRGRPEDLGRALLLLDESGEAAAAMGMRPLASAVAGLIAELRGRTSRARPVTARERQVARLVAHGLTNREIACALALSERTAANHVQHIFDKLGFSSRSQVAAWVVKEDALREHRAAGTSEQEGWA